MAHEHSRLRLNPVAQWNVANLKATLPNLTFIGPEHGWQAAAPRSAGRMSEAEAIWAALAMALET